MPALVRSHPIIEVREGYVICGGPQPTAPTWGAKEGLQGMHHLLRPMFHDGDYDREPGATVEVGHAIDEFDDGSRPRHRAIKHA